MLLRQQRCRNQNCDLLAILDSFKSSTHGNFGFTVAHVSHDDAIHGNLRFHVTFDGIDGHHLIFCLNVGEVVFHLHLPGRIRWKLVPRGSLPLGVELHQFTCDFSNRSAGFLLGVFPIRPTHL